VTLDLFGQTIELTAALIVLNVAYVIYTVSAAFKDVFLLRVLLLAATVLYIVYGVIAPNRSIFLTSGHCGGCSANDGESI